MAREATPYANTTIALTTGHTNNNRLIYVGGIDQLILLM